MSKNKSRAPIGASLVVISSIFYASYGIWTRLMGNFFGGYTASALRSIVVLLILIPFAIVYRRLEKIRWRHNWHYLVGMVVASFFVWGPLYYAILHAGIGISLTINYTCFIIGMFLFGWWFANERFTKNKQISALLGLVGLGLVFSPSQAHLGWLPLGAAAISGLGAAGVTFITKQISYSTTQTTVALWTTSVIANTLMAIILKEAHPAIGWHAQWLYLVLFAVASIIASWSLIKGLKLIEAGAAGILGLLEIVFGVLFGVAFFHERLSAIVITGIAIIITAAAIPYLNSYRSSQQ